MRPGPHPLCAYDQIGIYPCNATCVPERGVVSCDPYENGKCPEEVAYMVPWFKDPVSGEVVCSPIGYHVDLPKGVACSCGDITDFTPSR